MAAFVFRPEMDDAASPRRTAAADDAATKPGTNSDVCHGYAVVTSTIRLRFDGRSTAYQRSLRSQ